MVLPLDPDWLVCPYCDADIPGVTPPRRSRRGGEDELEPAYGPGDDATLVADAPEQPLPPSV